MTTPNRGGMLVKIFDLEANLPASELQEQLNSKFEEISKEADPAPTMILDVAFETRSVSNSGATEVLTAFVYYRVVDALTLMLDREATIGGEEDPRKKALGQLTSADIPDTIPENILDLGPKDHNGPTLMFTMIKNHDGEDVDQALDILKKAIGEDHYFLSIPKETFDSQIRPDEYDE